MNEDPFDVFLSYNRSDQEAAERVASALLADGLRVFLDRWYLTPGCPWPEALERSLASCRAVAVLLGPGGLGPWQQREQYQALDRQARTPEFRVVPVVLPGTADPALGFLGLNTWVDLRTDLDRGLGLLAKAVRGEPAGPAGQGPDPRAAVCPYRGLQPFREEDAPFFCGREAFTAALVERVASQRLVAVVGASGSGKSSVVRAGLVPALRRGEAGGEVWEIAVVRPGREPMQALAAALLPPDAGADEFDRIALLRRRAEQLATGDVPLPDVVARMLERQPGTGRVLLVVDQAEELFTLAEEAARRRFVELLLDATRSGPLTVVLTLRGDFYGRALEHRPLADRLDRAVVNLGPMTRDELARAVREPAAKVGLGFEEGLVERILADVGGEPGNLPLLEFLLEGLWRGRARGCLAHRDYDALGGVAGAIATRADLEYRRLEPERQLAARRFLVRLVAPGEGREDTRAVVELPAGDPVLGPIVQRFVDARLLVADRSDLRGGKELVEVSHEALIRSWAELRRWVDEDRELLRARRRVEEARSAWAAEGCRPDRLLQPGRPLGEAEELVERRPDFVDRDLRAYIAASRSRARRAARGRKLVAAGAVALAVVASVAAWAAKQSRDQAERQRIVAEENRALAEHRSRSLEAALAEARANLIWSSLELRTDPLGPGEVDALWQLSAAGPDVRRAFLRQLDENRSSVLKLVRRPAPVLRALGLVLPAEEARALLRPLLREFDDTADPSTLAALARAVRAVPARLTREQAEAALRPVLDGFGRTNDPYALQALAEAAGALPVRLTAEQGRAALGSVLGTFRRATDPYALHALATAVQALPLRLSGEQAQAALEPILAGFARTSDAYALRALAEAAQALQVRLAGEQVDAALVPILRGFRSTNDPYALQALAEATRSVAARLTDDRAQVALAPILGGFRRTNDPYALQALAEAAAALPVRLSSQQAAAALGPVLAASRDNSEADSLQALAHAVRALAPNLGAERARALLGPVLDTLKGDARPASLPLVVQAAKALVPSLPVEAEIDALRLARSGLAGARSGAEAVAWAAAFEATLRPAGGYLGSVIEALKYPTSALEDRKASGDDPASAEEYLLGELRALPDARGLRAVGLDGVLAWIAERHPEIDLARPPARPAPVDRAILADQAR